jgi:serine/threonine protein kinase
MSPEQAKGKALDGRSDMFTLGTVIWELLTGYRLFKANSDFDILTKVLKSEIIHPSRFGADVPVELGDIVMRTLERNRDLRYQDCGELARVLETWIVANGDGSDTQLGNMALALTNRQGHSYMEAPEFVRGPAEFTCVDNEFVPTGNASSNQFGGGGSELGGPTEAVAAPSPFQINAAMQQQPMQPAM